MNAATIKNHRLSDVDLRSRRSVQQRHMLHTRAVYIAVQLYIITACIHGCIDVLYTCGDNDVISSYHVYASCFFAMMCGKPGEMFAIVASNVQITRQICHH